MHTFKTKSVKYTHLTLFLLLLLFLRVSLEGNYTAPPYSPWSLKYKTNLDSWLISSIFYCSKLHLSRLKLNLLVFIFYSILASINIFKSLSKSPSYGISPDNFLSPKCCLFILAQYTMCRYLQYLLNRTEMLDILKRIITSLSAAIICG